MTSMPGGMDRLQLLRFGASLRRPHLFCRVLPVPVLSEDDGAIGMMVMMTMLRHDCLWR